MRNKYLYIKILAVFVFQTYAINSQESEFLIVDSIDVNIKIDATVKDLAYDGTYFYLLTKENIYTINNVGNVIGSVSNNDTISGVLFHNDNLFTINKKGRIENINTKSVEADLKIGEEIFNTYFLAANETSYFTYFIIGSLPERISYSSRIISIDNQSNKTIFSTFQGLPAGLYCDNNYLWHLSNTGFFLKYNISDGKIISKTNIPVKDPVGITADNHGYIYTYSTFTKMIYKLQIL